MGLEEMIEGNKLTIGSLEEKVKENDIDLENLGLERAELRNQYDALKSIEIEAINLKEAVSGLTADKSSLEDQLAKLKSQSSDDSSQMEDLTKVNNDLNCKVADLKLSLSQLKESCTKMEAEKEIESKDHLRQIEKI